MSGPRQRRGTRKRRPLSPLASVYGERNAAPILRCRTGGPIARFPSLTKKTNDEWAAEFRVNARRSGRTVDMRDALVAGIARANALAVATRNVADFERFDIEVFNPWEAP